MVNYRLMLLCSCVFIQPQRNLSSNNYSTRASFNIFCNMYSTFPTVFSTLWRDILEQPFLELCLSSCRLPSLCKVSNSQFLVCTLRILSVCNYSAAHNQFRPSISDSISSQRYFSSSFCIFAVSYDGRTCVSRLRHHNCISTSFKMSYAVKTWNLLPVEV